MSRPQSLRHGLALLVGLALLLPGRASAAPAKPTATSAKTPAANVSAVQEHVLANGMKVLLVPRHLSPTVS